MSMRSKRPRVDGAFNLEPGQDVVKLDVLSLTGEILLKLDAVTSMLGRDLWDVILRELPSQP